MITHDKNFGNIPKNPNIKHKGIIFVRCKNQSPEKVSNILLNVLKSEITEKFKDSLVVISEDQANVKRAD